MALILKTCLAVFLTWVIALAQNDSLLGLAKISALPDTLSQVTRYDHGQVKERLRFKRIPDGSLVKHGLQEEFFSDGNIKGLIPWEDGRENGTVVFYHPGGRKSYESNYVEGKKTGYATVWYLSGQKQWQTTFKAGKTHGLWREWYQDGKKKFEANYADGRLEGMAQWFYPNGRLQQERVYVEGKAVPSSVRAYNAQGVLTYPTQTAKTETLLDSTQVQLGSQPLVENHLKKAMP